MAAVVTLAGGSSHRTPSGGFLDGRRPSFMNPTGVAVAPSDSKHAVVYIADTNNHRVRVVDPKSGETRTLAGGGRSSMSYESTYAADAYNHRIRKISPDGMVSTLAGSGPTGGLRGGYRDGPGSDAMFNHPRGIACDNQGNCLVADCRNHRIRKVTPCGTVSTIAGCGPVGSGASGYHNGPFFEAKFDHPVSIAFHDGAVFVADYKNNCVRKLAGSEVTSIGEFKRPTGVAVDRFGNVFVTVPGSPIGRKEPGKVHKVCGRTGSVSILAGGGSPYTGDAIGKMAGFGQPCGVAVDDKSGRLIVVDSARHTIRSMTSSIAFWSSPVHRLFSPQVKQVIRTVLLCSQRLQKYERPIDDGAVTRKIVDSPSEIWLAILSFLPDWKSMHT